MNGELTDTGVQCNHDVLPQPRPVLRSSWSHPIPPHDLPHQVLPRCRDLHSATAKPRNCDCLSIHQATSFHPISTPWACNLLQYSRCLDVSCLLIWTHQLVLLTIWRPKFHGCHEFRWRELSLAELLISTHKSLLLQNTLIIRKQSQIIANHPKSISPCKRGMLKLLKSCFTVSPAISVSNFPGPSTWAARAGPAGLGCICEMMTSWLKYAEIRLKSYKSIYIYKSYMLHCYTTVTPTASANLRSWLCIISRLVACDWICRKRTQSSSIIYKTSI